MYGFLGIAMDEKGKKLQISPNYDFTPNEILADVIKTSSTWNIVYDLDPFTDHPTKTSIARLWLMSDNFMSHLASKLGRDAPVYEAEKLATNDPVNPHLPGFFHPDELEASDNIKMPTKREAAEEAFVRTIARRYSASMIEQPQ
jgi:hypothetical protein